MTGFERWVDAHRTTPEEIKILMKTEGINIHDVFGSSLTSEDPVPLGRATALDGMLTRGRDGSIAVPINVIASVLNKDFTSLHQFVQARNYPGYDQNNLKLPSDSLPFLLADIFGTQPANAPAPDTAPDENPDTAAPADETPENPDTAAPADETPENDADDNVGMQEPAAVAVADQKDKTPKPAARRKTKYSVTKAVAIEMFHPAEADMPVREIRAFLLSLPQHKPQDVALMSDKDASDVFGKDYICVNAASGTLIMPRRSYDGLINFMSGNEIYHIPSAKQETD